MRSPRWQENPSAWLLARVYHHCRRAGRIVVSLFFPAELARVIESYTGSCRAATLREPKDNTVSDRGRIRIVREWLPLDRPHTRYRRVLAQRAAPCPYNVD